MRLAFCWCTVPSVSRFAASGSLQRLFGRGLRESVPYAIRGIDGNSLLCRFLETVRSILPYTPSEPSTQEARWVRVITAAAAIILLVWKLLFRRDTPWATILYLPVQWWPRRSRDHDDDDNDRIGGGPPPGHRLYHRRGGCT
ncbi:unnamed protein product [Calypogeia fissa]